MNGLSGLVGVEFHPPKIYPEFVHTAHTHTMETHSMEKVPSMEKFSINQTE